jgi:hypothetical protein
MEDLRDEARGGKLPGCGTPKTWQWSQSTVDPNIMVKDYSAHWKTLIASTVKPRTLTSYTISAQTIQAKIDQ